MSIYMVFLHAIAMIVYVIAIIMCYRLSKKLYGGRYTSSLPYFLASMSLFLGMVILDQVDLFFSELNSSSAYLYSIQALQLMAGVFLILALYQIYQLRYMTEGFKEVK